MKFCTEYTKLPDTVRDNLSYANVFYSFDYYNNVKGRGQNMMYLWSEDYILALRIRTKLFFKVAICDSEPFRFLSSDITDERAFLDDVMKILKKEGVQWTFSTPTSRFQYYPVGSSVVKSGNHVIDLTLSEDELWAKVHSKHRNSIRRGEKSNIEIIIGGKELLSEYSPISASTYERSHKSDGGLSYLESIISNLDDCEKIMIARFEGQVHAGGMFYYNNAIAYYLHGASIGRPEPGATNYLLWKAILYFKKLGVKEFSFVGYHFDPDPGSKLDGIQRFKERFGGKLEESFYFRNVQNKFFYNVYKLYMQLVSGSPLTKYKDAIDEQIDKYPELNKK